MNMKWIEEHIPYTGAELRPHFLLQKFGLRGSSVAAFTGPCRVETAELVDWEDRLADDRIEAREMLHVMGEFFGLPLREGVWLQRWIAAWVTEHTGGRKNGNDVFHSDRKLSVSIVTASPVSTLLHFGINIDPTGAPVPAIGLTELKLDPKILANSLMESVLSEFHALEWACAKVKPVY